MTYSFKYWPNPKGGSERLYVQGTTRSSLYLTFNGTKLVWSSKANDTPHRFQTGDHYGKVNKDHAAACEVCEAFGIELGGDENEWLRAKQFARDGIQISA